jgi:hypothetical protein
MGAACDLAPCDRHLCANSACKDGLTIVSYGLNEPLGTVVHSHNLLHDPLREAWAGASYAYRFLRQ